MRVSILGQFFIHFINRFSIKNAFRGLLLLCLASGAAKSANVATSYYELPPGSFPALYYWSKYYSSIFGPYSNTYRYGKHPGYERRTNYYMDLDNGRGFLVEHPSALATIFAEAEAKALEYDGPWQKYLSVTRTSPFEVRIYGNGFPASWDVDIFFKYGLWGDTGYVGTREASWNFGPYSGRACPDNYDLWALKPAVDVEEYFCAPKLPSINKEKNLGAFCPLPGQNQSPISLLVQNPVHAATGNKYQRVPVYKAQDGGPLRYELFYNSHATKGVWTNTYSRSVSGYFDTIFQNYDDARNISQAKYLAVTVRREDGKMFRYRNIFDWDSRTTELAQWEGAPDLKYRLESVNDPVTGGLVALDLFTPENTRERYDLKGKLQSIRYVNGQTVALQYGDDGRLETVLDDYGNTLAFSYGSGVTTLTIPGGAQYRLVYSGSNLVKVVFPDDTPLDNLDNPRRQYHYNEPLFTSGADLPNALTGITDERGIRYATYEYDVEGRAIATYHAGNAERADITYGTGNTRTVTNSKGVSTTYTVTNQLGMALPKTVTGPACAECGSSNTSYSYDPANNNLLSKTENGVITQYGDYDGNGNYGYKIEALGTSEERRTDYTYDPRFNGKIATVTEPSVVTGLNKVTTYDYDDYGNRTLVRIDGYKPDEQGGGIAISRSTAYQYGGDGTLECDAAPLRQLCQIDGPRTDVSDITRLNYYPNDEAEGHNRARLKEIIDANGSALRGNIQYTASGKVESEDRPNGLHLDYTYYPGNDRLEMITQTDTSGASRTTRWTYLATGEVESITQAHGTADVTTITFGYDDARRLEKITDGLGNYIQYTLDTEGNKEAEEIYDSSNALRKALSRTFDDYNRLDTSLQANESVDYHFSVSGTLDTVTDGKNSVTDYDYDNLKRLLTATQDLGGINASTQYGYDAQDNLISVTDPIGGNTSYTYDDLGNLLSQDSPDTGITSFSYDAAGNIQTKQDAKGQQFTYTYDLLNRLTYLDAPGEEDDIRYEYDACQNGIGRLCSVTMSPNTATPVTVVYSYNAFGEVASHQGVGYGYDNAGRIDAIAYPSGAVVGYQYDAAGQISRVELNQNGQISVLAGDIQYHPFGPVSGLTYGNGQSLSQIVDTAYRYTDIDAAAALNHGNIQYDPNGNLSSRSNDGINEGFGYDALNRLETAGGRFGDRLYQYDRNGNRLEKQEGEVLVPYAYEPNSNRMAAADGNMVALDKNGNTLSNGEQTYTYTRHNRLKDVSSDSGLLGQYRYNGLGQRIEKDTAKGTLGFQYGLDGALLAESAAQGIQREYIYLNGQPLAIIDYRYIPPAPEDVVLDESATEVTTQGGWQARKGRRSHENAFLLSEEGIESKARWTPALDGGVYDLYGWWPQIKKNSTAVPVSVKHAGGETTLTIDQASTGRDWIWLGQYAFEGDGTGYVELSNANGPVAADSLRWVKNLEVSEAVVETALYYVHNDHLGTPQAMSDSLGNAVWKATYGPFGQTGVDQDPDGDGQVVGLNLMFPGQYYDQETGLHYNYYRTYDPSTGRYLESDPIGLLGGLNTYAYVAGNPLMYFDPDGLIMTHAQSRQAQREARDAHPLSPDPRGEHSRCVIECFAKRELICSPYRLGGIALGLTVGGIGSIPSGGTAAVPIMKGGAALGSWGGRLACEIMFDESCFEECEQRPCETE